MSTCFVCGIGLAAVYFFLLLIATAKPQTPLALPILWIALIAILTALALVVRSIVRRLRTPWSNWFRMARFAAANSMLFAGEPSTLRLPGLIFRVGKDRITREAFVSTSELRFLYGNHRYTGTDHVAPGAGEWGFVSVLLDRHIPHLVLEARRPARTLRRRLPALFARDQVLSLEGDFDRYFTLYAPREYERDALYVLTPDLMALLIDNASPFDVEIVDNQLFIYSPEPFDFGSPASHGRIARLIDSVGAKARSQTARYTDVRASDPTTAPIAPGGRRLVPRSAVAFTAIAVLAFIVLRVLEVYGH